MDEKLLREMDEQWRLVWELAAEGKKRNAVDVARLLRRVVEDEAFSAMLDAPQTATPRPSVETKGGKPLLESVGTVEVPATRESFQVAERFAVDSSSVAPVRISHELDTFNNWFGKMLVDAHPGSTLAYYVLTRDAYDQEILSAFGGEAKCEITLAEIWQLMSMQKNGEGGALLTNGCANIFYVRDSSSALRAVRVYWTGSGWLAIAYVFDCFDWSCGRRVFVRNS